MCPAEWEGELQCWLGPFVESVGRQDRRRWAPVYVHGLIAPGERKSIEPLARAVAPGAPGAAQALHHFVTTAPWDPAPLEARLAAEAQRLVGGPDAVLIVDDTTLPKKGTHSVSVAHQYSGALGKQTPCQTLVSLTLARREVAVSPSPSGCSCPGSGRTGRRGAAGRACRRTASCTGRSGGSRSTRSTECGPPG